MNILLLLSHIGKKVQIELKNGFLINGKLQTCSREGLFLNNLGEMLYIRTEEIKGFELL